MSSMRDDLHSILLIGATGFVGTAVRSLSDANQVAVTPSVREWKDDLIGEATSVIDLEKPDEFRLPERQFDIVMIVAALMSSSALDGLRSLIERYPSSRFVLLSSDAVFGGSDRPMSELDPPCPATDHGNRMCEAETSVLEHPDSVVVRCSYIYSESTENLDRRSERIRRTGEAGEIIQASTNVFKSPVSVQEVAWSLLGIGITSSLNGIVHIAGPRRSVHDFFRERTAVVGVSPETIVRKDAPELIDTSLVSVRSSEVISRLCRRMLT